MIQRQQTLWLILATVCAFLSFQFPFLTGERLRQDKLVSEPLDAGSNLFALILTAASLIISLVTIFFFKDRKLQSRLCIAGILLSVIIITLYIVEMQEYEKSTLALYAVLPLIVLISYYMAYRGIRRDEKLVRSLDKLR